jgi:hypothetical protein
MQHDYSSNVGGWKKLELVINASKIVYNKETEKEVSSKFYDLAKTGHI